MARDSNVASVQTLTTASCACRSWATFMKVMIGTICESLAEAPMASGHDIGTPGFERIQTVRQTSTTLHLIIPLDTVRPAGHDAITYSRIRIPPRHLTSIRYLVETPLSSIPTLRNIRRGPEHRPLIAW
jgi:hypothetical protein